MIAIILQKEIKLNSIFEMVSGNRPSSNNKITRQSYRINILRHILIIEVKTFLPLRNTKITQASKKTYIYL